MKSKMILAIMAGLAISATVLAGCIPQSTAPQTSRTITLTIPTSSAPTTTVVATTPPVTNSTPPTSTAPPTGSIEVRVTDAPPSQQVTAVSVTVSSVEILKTGGKETEESAWLPLTMSGPTTFDLLMIQGLEQVLSTGTLNTGAYTQIRMAVGKVQVTLQGGQPQDATVPSGKIKFVQPFSVVTGKTTVLLFDFIASQSVNVTGEGKIIFKPVIKLIVPKTTGSLNISTDRLPNGEVGIAYSATLAVQGGAAPYTWSVTKGSLPTGLTLASATGVISGAPTADGDISFTLQASDSAQPARNNSQGFTVNIAPAGELQVTTTFAPDGMANAPYSVTLAAVGGTAPYAWSITGGGLPDGLTLDSATGIISGTTATRGDFNCVITVTDSTDPAATDSQTIGLHIDKDLSQ